MFRVNNAITIFSIFILSFYTVGCASIPSVISSKKELINAEEALNKATAKEGAMDTQEYEEANALIAKAKNLMQQCSYGEAAKVLGEARIKAMASIDRAEEKRQREIIRRLAEISNNLEDILFGYNQSSLRSKSKRTLDKNASILMKEQELVKTVVLEGYCDIRGTDEYNLALGQKRAESTKSYLLGIGIPASMVKTVSRGETQKWSEGKSEDSYKQNRRVHFIPLAGE